MKNFDKLCNRILQEQQYNITAREVLYKRYGKNAADNMISKIRARGKDSYLDKKYVLPDYSDKNLDRVIPVIFKDFKKMIPANNTAAYGIPTGIPFINPHIGINLRNSTSNKDTRRELEGGPINYGVGSSDLIGHEITHTLQKGIHVNPNNVFEYPLQYDIAPVLGEIKRWYYRQTGILLDIDSSDSDIQTFIEYCRDRNIFNRSPYGGHIDFEKLLRTSEGKEVFRRIVKQTSIKKGSLLA